MLSFKRQRYIVQTEGAPRYALRGQAVTVIEYPGCRIKVLHDTGWKSILTYGNILTA